MGRPASTITKQTNPRAIPGIGQQWFTCTAEEGVKPLLSRATGFDVSYGLQIVCASYMRRLCIKHPKHPSVKHLYDNKTRPHDPAHLEEPHGSWRSDPTSLPPRPGSDQWISMGRRIQRHIKHGQTMANDDASAHSATAAPLNPGKSGASGAGASQATLRGI